MKHYPYRFKTEEEFIKKFSHDWKIYISSGWNVGMDKFFGKPYEYDINKSSRLPGIRDNDGSWRISWDMLVKNIKVPNYKPKKIII